MPFAHSHPSPLADDSNGAIAALYTFRETIASMVPLVVATSDHHQSGTLPMGEITPVPQRQAASGSGIRLAPKWVRWCGNSLPRDLRQKIIKFFDFSAAAAGCSQRQGLLAHVLVPSRLCSLGGPNFAI